MAVMVGAADTQARETWEEAGLRVADLIGVAHGGHVLLERPSSGDGDGGAGYMVERIDWFRARLPDGMLPCNQDGEVQRFELLPPSTLRAWLVQGLFTLEAGLVIAGFLGL
ncbi:NUDIX domain-containing protein [Verminephrobacter aporrectodeae]|uniref:NUDIX domain-containing protein n=1 Tax=Verminephrobacter aporrectodeae TaxID=1110389 RepID=UPI002ADD557D|nr:NUDIX domain-containing protein [Verminephrobacter aporrectodeae]